MSTENVELLKELKKIIKQNEVMISLLGRMAFTPEQVRQIVISRKKNPEKYIEGYNALNGTKTVSEVAKIAGVTQPNMTNILQQWEELGIIYEVEKPGGKFFKKLFWL